MGVKAPAATLMAVCACLWAVGVAVTATYYVPGTGITYTTPLTWSRILELLPRIAWQDIRSAIGLYDALFVMSLGLVAVAMRTRGRNAVSFRIVALALPVVLLFPLNAIGGLTFILDVLLYQPYDGEFLAEGWPAPYVFCLWTLGAAFLAWRSYRQRPVGPQNTETDSGT